MKNSVFWKFASVEPTINKSGHRRGFLRIFDFLHDQIFWIFWHSCTNPTRVDTEIQWDALTRTARGQSRGRKATHLPCFLEGRTGFLLGKHISVSGKHISFRASPVSFKGEHIALGGNRVSLRETRLSFTGKRARGPKELSLSEHVCPGPMSRKINATIPKNDEKNIFWKFASVEPTINKSGHPCREKYTPQPPEPPLKF